ncbi:F-box protein At3g07870-like [Rhododendron vialii]|uniref:F-box protein At3g07870-like n=1 Tax=Rhododendron vialii TaxID=182163 RepID=UPI00265FB896|nr:F-box protein At3g07870-like [Rhododendron vialii]XP_058213106.1 F-box protein At3g07870-like [Rhododendron vialii]
MASARSTMARAIFHLPIDITLEILSRLPVKSLLRFKSVCKNWNALIKSPDFISKHLRTHPTLGSTFPLVTTRNRETQNYAISLVNVGFGNGPIDLDFPFLKSRYLSIAGICNGLVCINLSYFGYPIVICNPVTKQLREIPNSAWNWLNESFDGKFYVQRESFGFGFHPSANDYKLIRILFYSIVGSKVNIRAVMKKHNKHNIRADLYSMSTDTWTEIDVDKLSLFFGEINGHREVGGYVLGEYADLVQIVGSSASAVLNGVFYWPAREVPTNRVMVMSFDMGDEVFRKIRAPACFDGNWNEKETNWRFTQLKDNLACFVYPNDKCLDVWVLNEDQSSWTNPFKVESFSRITNNVGSGQSGEMTVLGFAKNGELVVTDHKVSGDLKLFLYDPKTRETTDLYFGQVPYPSSIFLFEGTFFPVTRPNEILLN